MRDRAAERDPAAALAPQQPRQRGAQRAGEPARGGALGRQRLLPQPRGRDRGHRPCPARQRELERHPAAERVAGHVRAVEAELGVDRAGEVGGRGGRGRRRLAEPGHVDREHLALLREPLDHRVPHVAVGAERVQEHERFTAAGAGEVDQVVARIAAVSAAEPPATAAVLADAPSGMPLRPMKVAAMSLRSPAMLATSQGASGLSAHRGGDREAVHRDLAARRDRAAPPWRRRRAARARTW